MKTLVASIKEHGDHVYITCPVGLYEPDDTEIETFAFASNVRSLAPNPRILWLKGQYVEADRPNRNADAWTEGELSLKALTPVLMPITVMHDLRSAVGTIADAKLLTPSADQVPRARIDSMLAVWEHRFPEVGAEIRANAAQSTLMQSMECLSPYYDCSACGKTMQRGPKWQKEWEDHIHEHRQDVQASPDRSFARTLRNVTFTGVGLIFGTRGARGAMPDAHLEVEELAAMHREAHASTTAKAKRPRRKNTVDLEDSKYESMVKAQADADARIQTLEAQAAESTKRVEELEAENVKLITERDAKNTELEAAKEETRIAAMRDERVQALGAGFRQKLDKMTSTAKAVQAQAGSLSDTEWEARLVELEEMLDVKRDATAEATPAKPEKEGNDDGEDALAGLLFTNGSVENSVVGGSPSEEVTAKAGGSDTPPSSERRQSVMGGLIRGPKKETAKA